MQKSISQINYKSRYPQLIYLFQLLEHQPLHELSPTWIKIAIKELQPYKDLRPLVKKLRQQLISFHCN